MTAKGMALVGAMLALAGCGGSSSPDQVATTGGAAWQATDACAVLDRRVIAEVLGTTVTDAKLSAVKDAGDGADLYSQCDYMLADGRTLVIGTGRATNGATVAEQVKDMRRQAAIMTTEPPSDLRGVGKAALWSAEVNALYAFFGSGRWVSTALGQPDFRKPQPVKDRVQADEIALVRRIEADLRRAGTLR